MRWRVIICAACALACPATALAQIPSPSFEPSKVNAARLRWLDYKLVAGRVVATSTYPAGMNISFGPSVIGGRLREHLQLLILEDLASVRYELGGDGQELLIVLAQNGEFSIGRTREKPKYAVHFSQQPSGKLSLTVDEADTEQRLDGDSFWHLYIERPDLVRRHLIPYLELLRPAWQLAATGFAIEEALVQRAQNPQTLDTQRWIALVNDLASPKFAVRQHAERELLRIGQVILPFLESLDRRALDAEQASRVATLVDALSVDYEDTADRIATWLVADRQIWLALLARDDEVRRQVAARQLAVLVGHPIEFDPAADAATRQLQLERLRARYANSRETAAPGADETAPSIPPPGVKR
ncbi:MAG: hypothetical protein WDZ48_08370 [Pirellulales bacterium]